MEKEPIIIHMNQMLRELPEGPFRAAYMAVSEMHQLMTGGKNNGR